MSQPNETSEMSPAIRPGQNPPFHEMNEYTFQDLCRDLLELEPDIATCAIYGVRGQSQKGIDLLARRKANDGIEVGQCKCCKAFSTREIQKACEEFLSHWDHWSQQNVRRFVLFVACDLSRRNQQDEISDQKKHFQKHDIEFEVWEAATIRNKLRPHPGIVGSYFSHAQQWIPDICGIAPSSFQEGNTDKPRTSVLVDNSLLTQVQQLVHGPRNNV